MGMGLTCADHSRVDRSCRDCIRIRQWYADGETPAPNQYAQSRTPEQVESAEVLVAVLTGRPESHIAAWCSVTLAQRSGPWAGFTGPQSVMTARFWALAREAQELTGADLAAA